MFGKRGRVRRPVTQRKPKKKKNKHKQKDHGEQLVKTTLGVGGRRF